MSKILPASCDASGVVKCEDYIVPEAIVMTEGKQASEGLLFMDKGLMRYIPMKQTSDLITLLDKISAALDQIANGLEAMDTNGYLIAADAGVPSGPVAAGNISSIRNLKSQLDDLKGALK